MAAPSELDDDESVLEPSEQTNRPPDVAFAQQRIPAWHPILDPLWVIIGLFYLGVILVPVGKWNQPRTVFFSDDCLDAWWIHFLTRTPPL